MNRQQCKDCIHFYQHYVCPDGERYMTTYCGHCVYPRIKKRVPDTRSCEHFAARQQEEKR